jgi:hypothetical protein
VDWILKQKIRSSFQKKKQFDANQATRFNHKHSPGLCIHVSFACNQQLTHFNVANSGSVMQSRAFGTRTESQNRNSEANFKDTTQHIISSEFQT